MTDNTDERVKIEIQSEDALNGIPGEIRIFDGERLVRTIFAKVEYQAGADRRMYPAVTLQFKDLSTTSENKAGEGRPQLTLVK